VGRLTPHKNSASKPTSGVELMALDLQERHASYPDVLYEVEEFVAYGQRRWGVRSTYLLPETDSVTSWMNYHSGVLTESDCLAVVARLAEFDTPTPRRRK